MTLITTVRRPLALGFGREATWSSSSSCALCPAFVNSCEGLERSWWNEHEWDEFEDHLPSG